MGGPTISYRPARTAVKFTDAHMALPSPGTKYTFNEVQNVRYTPKENRNAIFKMVNRNPVIRTGVTRENSVSTESVAD
jgi:hypothetical protein